MRIAQIAPLTELVPPRLYGGTERVVSFLTEQLVDMGHEVTLFASGDFVTRAELAAVWPTALRFDGELRDAMAPHLLMLEQVCRRAHEFDVLHLPSGLLAILAVQSPGYTVSDNAARAARSAGTAADLRLLPRGAPGFHLRCATRAAAECQFCCHGPAWIAARPADTTAEDPELPCVPGADLPGKAAGSRDPHCAGSRNPS